MKKRPGKKLSSMSATVAVVLCLAMLTASSLSCSPVTEGGREATGTAGENQGQAGTQAEVGGPFEGYTLLAPLQSDTTYLIDNDGEVTHTWESNYPPGNAAYLLENGNLLRCASLGPDASAAFEKGGAGGRVEEITWDGDVAWEFEYANDQHLLHHDIEHMPNGNVLMISWEKKSAEEAIAAGRDPELLKDGELWPDHIIEVEPDGNGGGNIVWEWHLWDHLIQDYDSGKPNYGAIDQHPELINLNYGASHGGADMTHMNSVDYNQELDQVLLSVNSFCEVWIIDHSTTTGEAAGHSGGNSGKGGDLLYRWGNPKTYYAGSEQELYSQHDAQWIENGNPEAGNILVFNNGNGRPDGTYSSVDEIITPVDSSGNYHLSPGSAYGPDKAVWSYTAENPADLFSDRISGAQRLPNGNTLICSGASGTLLEVTADKAVVWEYVNPYGRQTPDGFKNSVFKVRRYPPDYPGLADVDPST